MRKATSPPRPTPPINKIQFNKKKQLTKGGNQFITPQNTHTDKKIVKLILIYCLFDKVRFSLRNRKKVVLLWTGQPLVDSMKSALLSSLIRLICRLLKKLDQQTLSPIYSERKGRLVWDESLLNRFAGRRVQ